MASQEEKKLIEGSVQEDLMNNLKSLAGELELTLEEIKNGLFSEQDIEDMDVDFITDINEEIRADLDECREMYEGGKRMLWKYKDFESEEHLNQWLKMFSDAIVEVKPSVNERLGFYVKIATSYL